MIVLETEQDCREALFDEPLCYLLVQPPADWAAQLWAYTPPREVASVEAVIAKQEAHAARCEVMLEERAHRQRWLIATERGDPSWLFPYPYARPDLAALDLARLSAEERARLHVQQETGR